MNQAELKQKLKDARSQRLVNGLVDLYWAKIPEELKDQVAWDVACYGAVTEETQRLFQVACEAALTTAEGDSKDG